MMYVTNAKYINQFKVRISFSNGDEGIVDLKDELWGEVFKTLQSPESFRQFELSQAFRTIQWPNGADFAPEFLHAKMVEQAAKTVV